MKRKLRFFSLFIVLFSVFLLSACQKNTRNVYQEVKKSNEITWGVKADTRLFGLMSIKTGKIEGFEVDLANALTKEILGKNAKANFVQTTAKTKIPLLKNGNIDAVLAAMTITPERKKQIDFSDPYFYAGQSLLVKDDSSIKNVRDLNGKTALAVKGTTAVDNYGQAFTALKAGQGQAMTTDNGLLAGIATENKGYKLVGGTYTNEPYGIAVNKGQTQMRNAINRALVKLKKDGTYDALVKKWFSGIPGFNIKEAEGEK